jgi:site-specific DNA-methyltransferase (adenine-specific)
MIETFTIGPATIYRADCLEVLPKLRDIDALITDPPYSSGGMVRGDRMQTTRAKYQSTDVAREHADFTGDNRDQRGFVAWSALWLMYALDAVKPGGIACLFSDWRQLPCMTDALQAGGWVWRGVVPWDKVNARPMPNRFRAQCEYVVWGTAGPRDFDMSAADYHPGILTEKPPANEDREHSTQKPVGIMSTLSLVAPAGGVVLDPFMGSGTTGVACIATGRRFIGIEKSHQHFATAHERITAAYANRPLELVDAGPKVQASLELTA